MTAADRICKMIHGKKLKNIIASRRAGDGFASCSLTSELTESTVMPYKAIIFQNSFCSIDLSNLVW